MTALSRSIMLLVLAASMAAASAAGSAEDAAESPPPVIEIVQEGGIADTYHREGADFAAYGPEGEARVAAAQVQALQALEGAQYAQFVSLDAKPRGTVPMECSASECIGGQAVLGRVPVQSREQRGLVRDVLAAWLREPARRLSACLPDYRYAVTFTSLGHDWEVLLCDTCGQYQIRRDGEQVALADAADKADLSGFDTVFSASDTPHR